MFLLKVQPFTAERKHEAEGILAKARAIQAERSSRHAAQYMIDEVGLEALPLYGEEYYSNVVDYLCAQVLSHAGRVDEASQLLVKAQRTGAPGEWEGLLFQDYIRISMETYQKQAQAIARNIPAFPIVSLPKSASASLSQTLANTFNMPVFRFSTGKIFQVVIVPHYLSQFLRGGGVTHDHCDASPANVACLESHNVKDLFIQVRDPRAAALSAYHMAVRCGQHGIEGRTLPDMFLEMLAKFNSWLEGWIRYHTSPDRKIKTHLIYFADVKKGLTDTAVAMIERMTLSAEQKETCLALLRTKPQTVITNYHAGNDNAWRQHISDDLAREAWQLIPPLVKDVLGMEA